ncbi:MAG: hypothetical protein AB9888_04945 [Bacteroidales bacterium]
MKTSWFSSWRTVAQIGVLIGLLILFINLLPKPQSLTTIALSETPAVISASPIGNYAGEAYPAPKTATPAQKDPATAYPIAKESTPTPQDFKPLPTMTATLRRSSPTPTPYFPPNPFGTLDSKYVIQTLEAIPTITRTVTKGVSPFPTLSVLKAAASDHDGSSEIWYFEYASLNSHPLLEKAVFNQKQQRVTSDPVALDLGLDSPVEKYPLRASNLYPSPDGKHLIVELERGDGAFYQWIDFTNHKVQQFDSTHFLRFYSWAPDSQQIVIIDSNTTSKLTLYNVFTQTFHEIPYSLPVNSSLRAFHVSPDGSASIDMIIQPSKSTRGWELDLGFRKNIEGDRKSICIIPGPSIAIENSLRWSPDGRRVAWISNDERTKDTKGTSDYQLWIADPAAASCTIAASIGRTNHYISMPVWAPDSQSVAFIKVEKADLEKKQFTGNVYRYDVNKKQSTPLTQFNKIISSVQFSPDGKILAFSAQRDQYSEILGINLGTNEIQPLAGPVPLNAPFIWIK